MAQAFPEIIIQRDKTIVGHSKQGNEATYSVMATMKENGNYTCKVETSQISKVSSIVVNITGRGAAGGCQPIVGSRRDCTDIWGGPVMLIFPLLLVRMSAFGQGVCSREKPMQSQ